MKKVVLLLALLAVALVAPSVKAGGCYSSYRPSYYPSSYGAGYYTVYPSQSFLYGSSYSYDYNRVVLTPVLLGYSSPPPVNITLNSAQPQSVNQQTLTQPQQAQPQTMPPAQTVGNAEILAAIQQQGATIRQEIKEIRDRVDKLEGAGR